MYKFKIYITKNVKILGLQRPIESYLLAPGVDSAIWTMAKALLALIQNNKSLKKIHVVLKKL